MRGQKPPPPGYPTKLRTLGDRLRKRRLDLGLRQKDAAERLGVSPDTVRNWEVGRAQPALWQWPALIRFLGYAPFDTAEDSDSLAARLKSYRQLHGVSHKRLAAVLGVDPSTVLRWKEGSSLPNPEHAARIEGLLKRSRPSP